MSNFDHKQKALSRVYAQYRDKDKTLLWMSIVGKLSNQIEGAYCDVAKSYDIDSAGTDELDVLGRIVVIGRSYQSIFTVPQFECNDTDVECGEPGIECTPGNITESQDVSNEIYRMLIKSKISKNNGDATIDSIIQTIGVIIPGANIQLIDNEDMSFTIIFNRLLNSIEKLVLTNFDLVQRPQGVRFDGFIENPSLVSCGEEWALCGEAQAECTFIF